MWDLGCRQDPFVFARFQNFHKRCVEENRHEPGQETCAPSSCATSAKRLGDKKLRGQVYGGDRIGNSQLFDDGTNVGLGTITPAEKLDVRGNTKLGRNGELYGPGGVENLLILRGQVNQDGSSPGQKGFSVTKPATGKYVVTLTTSPPYPGGCLAVVTPVCIDGSQASAVITQWTGGNVFSFSVSIFDGAGALADRTFFFIAVVARE